MDDKRVLLVEDDSSQSSMLRLELKRRGFRVDAERTESTAIARIESSGLCYGGTYKEANDAKQGTVFKQSAPANTQLTEYSKVYIWVSDGPAKP